MLNMMAAWRTHGGMTHISIVLQQEDAGIYKS